MKNSPVPFPVPAEQMAPAEKSFLQVFFFSTSANRRPQERICIFFL